jgi:hypothetical protein
MFKIKNIIWVCTIIVLFLFSYSILYADTNVNSDKLSRHRVDTGKMLGFHIDMNIKEFKADYLKRWLSKFASFGYNTIVWEVEHNIQWQTCPECTSPDAFSKSEFKKLLEYSNSLKLESIPVLQTIAHCEYVLKNPRYKHLAEIEDEITQYCPRNPEVVKFLIDWMNEYLEVFQDVKYFHLGADEAWWLGKCDVCKIFAEKHSISELYIEHLNAVSQPLQERGIRPVIWGDMVLHYPEALDKLPKNVLIFDWAYGVYEGCEEVRVWGTGYRKKGEFNERTLRLFGEHLFPYGDEPRRTPEFMYTSDFLVDKGFEVVACPTSNSGGDNIFSPRTYYHMQNTFDLLKKGLGPDMEGMVLTSWTVRLVPWELQLPTIEIVPFVQEKPFGTLKQYQQWYVDKHFGTKDQTFFNAVGSLSRTVLFSDAKTLGFYKSALPVKKNHISEWLDKIAEKGELEKEINESVERLSEYERGLEILEHYEKIATKGHEELNCWKLAAKNLIHRAQAARLLLQSRLPDKKKQDLQDEAKTCLSSMRHLKKETKEQMSSRIKTERLNMIIDWIYQAVEYELLQVASLN